MRHTKKTEFKPITQKLRDWYFSHTVAELPDVREKLITECKISYTKLQNWLQGKSIPGPLELDAINRVANQNIFES